jgi:hypothetical protein
MHKQVSHHSDYPQNERRNCIFLQTVKDFVAQKLYFKQQDAWSWEVRSQGKYASWKRVNKSTKQVHKISVLK